MQPELTWVERLDDDSLTVCVDVALYSSETLFRACYNFTDRCYLFLEPSTTPSQIRVRFTRKSADCDMNGLVGEFANELVNQRIRRDIGSETRTVRELIVAQAFTEADLLGQELGGASYIDDPKGIAQ